jgi:hypothetical protein
MRPLSATECISPAIQRARDFLTRPFRWGTFIKLAAIAVFAESGGSFNYSNPGKLGSIRDLAPSLVAFLIAFAVIIGVVSLVIALAMLYLRSRLQMVLVELVATGQTLVRPAWRRCGWPTWRWIGFKVLFLLGSILFVGVLAAPLGIVYISTHAHGWGDFPSRHLVLFGLSIAAAVVVVLLIAVVYMLVHDLAMPSIALEDCSISESLRRLRAIVTNEAGAVAVYVILRILLGLAIGLAAEFILVFVLLLSLLPFGLVGGAVWLVLHNAGAMGTAVLIGCAVIAALVYICWAIFVGIVALGPVFIFNQAFALYFLGGRYPMLGDLLDRSTPPPANPYPGTFPPYYPPPVPSAPLA